MDLEILEEIGLSKTEIKLFLSLIKLGQSTTTPIMKDSGVPASKVYEFLEKLIKKGLVSYIVKFNKKHFKANPNALKEYIKEKEEKIKAQETKINQIIPQLNALQVTDEKIKAEVYEGLEGIKLIYNKILSELKKGGTQYIIGAPRIGNELIEGFLLDWHKKRIKKNIKCRYIYDSDAKDFGKIRKQMPLTEVRYMPRNISSPVWIEIFEDYVVTGHIKGHTAILFLIKDREIAESYLDYFNLIWKQSER